MKDKKKYLDNSGAVEYKKRAELMTFEELRKRLKHIEILCCGLSIDLANEIEWREYLETENAELKVKLIPYDKILAKREAELAKLPTEERVQRDFELYKKRKQVSESRKKKAVKSWCEND